MAVHLYYQLCKPGIVRMVMITAAMGYLLAPGPISHWPHFIISLLGIGFAAAGAAVLNNYLERDIDALMDRTAHRALPSGKIKPGMALIFGISLVFLGTLLCLVFINFLTAFLVLLSALLYVLVYTPLKRITWLNTSIGAIPGALPMSCGWVAVTGQFDIGAWILFVLLFAWQHPHFYAIAWMYKDDYAKAGFKMLSVIDAKGHRLFVHVILYSFLMLAVSALPFVVDLTGWVYLVGAMVLGFYMIYYSLKFCIQHTLASAKALMKASIIYLPGLLAVVALDIVFKGSF